MVWLEIPTTFWIFVRMMMMIMKMKMTPNLPPLQLSQSSEGLRVDGEAVESTHTSNLMKPIEAKHVAQSNQLTYNCVRWNSLLFIDRLLNFKLTTGRQYFFPRMEKVTSIERLVLFTHKLL